MKLTEIKDKIPNEIYEILTKDINELRPSQSKDINAGLLDRKNLLVCTPTASGKTLIAELCATKAILGRVGKAIYIVPLKALASEKYKDFTSKYGKLFKIGISVGDKDKADSNLGEYDFLFVTSEKLDALLRHSSPWIKYIATVIVDEIHLINDPTRGPTLEILLTMLKQLLPNAQIIGLSATIGNPKELASWLDATLVTDDWRPVTLERGIYFKGEIIFNE